MTKQEKMSDTGPGRAWLVQRGPFYVGTSYQFDVVYEVGARPVQWRGEVSVVIPGTLGWGTPHALGHREDPNLCTVWSSNPDAVLTPEVHPLPLPLSNKSQLRIVKAVVTRGEVLPGETITIRLGDTRHGWGPGFMTGIVASMPRGHVELFEVSVRTDPSAPVQSVADVPVEISPRPAESFEVLAPSLVQADTDCAVSIKAQDLYKNADVHYAGRMELRGPGGVKMPQSVEATTEDHGIGEVTTSVKEGSGTVRIEVRDEDRGIRARSNPFKPTTEDAGRLLWGELHCHSAISRDNKNNGLRVRPADMVEIGRDVNRLDFMWMTDHFEPQRPQNLQITPEEWIELTEAVKNAHRKDRFLPFLGMEYRGNEGRGDTNILFLNREQPLPGPKLLDVPTVWDVYERLGHDFMTIPHLHSKLGKFHSDGRWPYVNPKHERLIEIHSSHGRHEYVNNYPWLKRNSPPEPWRTVQDLLAKGLRYGIVGGSDGHKGHPGQGSMTAVYADACTDRALWDGLMARRCYATTHARILLEFSLNDQPMGTEIDMPRDSVRDPGLERRIRVNVAGTDRILKADVVRNGKDCFSVRPEADTATIEWEDSEIPEQHVFRHGDDWFVYYYIRVRQDDGEMAWSSPVWLNFR